MWKFLLLALVAETTLGYLYYKDTQKQMAVLNQNNAKLEIAVQTNEATITALQTSYAQAAQEISVVNEEFRQIREQNQVLATKLQEHDIGVLGSAKPVLVERVINNASAKALRCFELLSGASLTEKEKEATSAQAFNSECPWLYSTQ